MSSTVTSNRLLAALPEAEFSLLRPELREEELVARHVLWQPGELAPAVYFPSSGMLSALVVVEEGSSIEGLYAGSEGALGVDALLSNAPSQWLVTVQVAGRAHAISPARLSGLLEQLPAFRALLYRYAASQQHVAAQSIACNRFHDVAQRLARWLLLLHDRVEGGPIVISHEFLGQMLGAHRPTVTLNLATFASANLIEMQRNRITVTDRRGLEEATCACYMRIVEDIERVFEQ